MRSSATAEDLPDASFAGQQETFLNVTGNDLLDRVKECWASLFTQRAIYYREQQGFGHHQVDIAVVVQQMVDAEKSGVMFTHHPSTSEPHLIIEAAWGLGEGVVSGSVSPDNYVIDRETGDLNEVTIADKKTMFVKHPETGETTELEVPEEKREARVLSEDEIDRLIAIGEHVEAHYETPQDVEWAICEDEIYMLQSRPITTIKEEKDVAPTGSGTTDSDGATIRTGVSTDEEDHSDKVLLRGLGASPGIVSGTVSVVGELDKVGEGDIIVTEMTTPDMVPALKRAVGIITNEGG